MGQGEQIDVVSTISIPPLVILGTVWKLPEVVFPEPVQEKNGFLGQHYMEERKVIKYEAKEENEE